MINRFTRVLNAGLLVPGLLLAVERPKEVQLSKSGLGLFHLFPVPQEPPSAIGLTGRLREVVNPNDIFLPCVSIISSYFIGIVIVY